MTTRLPFIALLQLAAAPAWAGCYHSTASGPKAAFKGNLRSVPEIGGGWSGLARPLADFQCRGRKTGKTGFWGVHTLGGTPPSAGPSIISRAYGKLAEGSFSVFGPLWKVGRRRLARNGGQSTSLPSLFRQFWRRF